MTKDQIRRAIDAHERRVLTVEQFPGFRNAAVLMLLFPEANELSILLTVRTDNVETHKGQVSCPGGMTDPEDTDAIATALRVTEEEVGIPRSQIEVLGMIDDHVTPS